MDDIRTGTTFSESETIALFGLPIGNITRDEASAGLVRDAIGGRRRQVFFVNAHCVNVAAHDRAYLEVLQAADTLYADGSGMRLAARMAGTPLVDNVNGTDLFPLLCRDAAEAGVGIAMLGARPGHAERCAQRMRERYPRLNVVWTHHGYLDDGNEEELIRSINASRAQILLVAMGVPAQEQWIARHAARLEVPVLLGVGALFDFYCGAVPRAPLALRRLGLEWLFRLSLEPRRLFRRYVVGNPLFVWRACLRRWLGPERLRRTPLVR